MMFMLGLFVGVTASLLAIIAVGTIIGRARAKSFETTPLLVLGLDGGWETIEVEDDWGILTEEADKE